MEINKYGFGSFVLDRQERRLWRCNREVKILRQQFDLLVIFIQNPDHLFIYDEILGLAWPDVYIDQASMQKAVGLLMRLLGDNRRQRRYIETVQRKGYRWFCQVRNLDTETTGVKKSAGRSQLIDSPLFKSMSQRQRADYYLNIALQAEEKLIGHEQVAWIDRLDHDYEDIQDALEYYVKHSMVVQELRLALALGRYWNNRGNWSQGREVLKRAIDRQPSGVSILKARGLIWAGHLATRQNDFAEARYYLTAGFTMSQSLRDQSSVALAALYLGFLASAEGRFEESKGWHETNLRLARRLKSDWLIAASMRGLGFITQDEGDYQETRDLHLKALTITERTGDSAGSATSLDRLAIAEIGLKDYSAARATYQKALALMKVTDKTNGLARCYAGIGRLQERTKNYREACSYFEKSLTIFQQIGNKHQVAAVMGEIGKIAKAMGKHEEAARIYGAADALRASIAAPLTPAERKDHGRVIASVQSLPGWAEAHEWLPERAIEYILKGAV